VIFVNNGVLLRVRQEENGANFLQVNGLTLSTTVYTVQHMNADKAQKPKRNNCPINVLIRHDQKQRLDSEVPRTHVNQSAMVRKALDLLFELMDKGQLKLGFSELDHGGTNESSSFHN